MTPTLCPHPKIYKDSMVKIDKNVWSIMLICEDCGKGFLGQVVEIMKLGKNEA